jgi:tetratricopeptide (TPR) repeat protein
VQTNGATRLYLARRLDEAAERLERIVEAQPTYLYARHMLAKVYMQQRRYPEAAVEFERWLAERGEPAEFGSAFAQPAEGLLGFVHAATGRRAEALALLEEIQERSKPGSQWPLGVAIIYMGLGETDQAFGWFDRAIKGRRADLWMKVDPLYDPLRSDARFDDLLRRIGFPES